MFHLPLFKIKAFAVGNIANLLSSLGRGGLMFILIIWLQGIWLPLHGYSFSATPLWAGIYMVPLTVGFLVSGRLAGLFSDRLRAEAVRDRRHVGRPRPASSSSRCCRSTSPTCGSRVLLVALGLSMGLFASPNRAQVMNSLPPGPARRRQRDGGDVPELGHGAVDRGVLQLDGPRPRGRAPGASVLGPDGRAGVPAADATRISHLPPVGLLFAAFLGDNPMRVLLGSTIHQISPAHARLLTSRSFFPALISVPFESGLRQAFDFAGGACVVAALASWLSGERYIHEEPAAGAASTAESSEQPVAEAGQATVASEEAGLSSPVGVGGGQ